MVSMAQDLPLDLGDEVQVKDRNRSLKARQREQDEALAKFLATDAGRDWMWELLSSCHTFHSPFSEDPTKLAFRVGEQNVGLRLLAHITRAAPEQYMLMMKEKMNVNG